MTLVLFTGLQISVSAAQSGDSWSLDDDGKLTVTTSTVAWRDAISDKTLVTSVEIVGNVTSIGYEAFKDCSNLTSVNIPSSVTIIGTNAFIRCSNLTSVTIPNSVTKIDVNAFAYCSSLTSLTIPDSVQTIGANALLECTSLSQIIYKDGLDLSRTGIPAKTTHIKYEVNDGKLTITDIIPKGTPVPTTFTIDTINGQTADTIIYKSGLTVSGDIVSPTTTKIEYTENDGKITISKIDVPNGSKAEIPTTINGMDVVAVAEEYRKFVDTTNHTTHTYENNVCTICGAEKEKPNTGDDDNKNDDNNDNKNITCTPNGSTLTISGTGAVNSGDLSAVGGKESITDVVIEDGITSVGDGAFDGFTNLNTVYYPQDTAVSENAFPENVTQVEYSETEDGVVITDIKPGDVVSEDGKVVIPDSIGGKDVVAVDEDVRDLVSPDEGHDHSYGEDGKCTICGADDESGEPVVSEPTVSEPTVSEPTVTEPTGSSPTGTSPTAPSTPPRPSAPSNPSSPSVTTAAAETTTVTVTTAEEIIADDNYTGEDVSAGAADNSDDGGITDMSMVVIVIAMAAVIACAVLIKKLIF